MKFITKYGLLILFIGMFSACSSTKITYDQSVDFKQYRTYAFYKKGIDALPMPPKKKKIILKALSRSLQQKGLHKSTQPDLIVNVFTDIHKRIDVYPGYYTPYYRRMYVEKSKEGTVYVDIVDMKRKKVVWSGSRYINYKSNDIKAINRAVTKLLERFPPHK